MYCQLCMLCTPLYIMWFCPLRLSAIQDYQECQVISFDLPCVASCLVDLVIFRFDTFFCEPSSVG